MTSLYSIKRSLGSFAAITGNRLLGRTFAPHPRRRIFIEPSGLCNLACRFCAYEQMPEGSLMPHELFERAIDEAATMGFTEVVLTPMLGEVFSDPGIYDKLDLLEADGRIESVLFYTNLIMARSDQLARLGNYRKLRQLFVSLYGIDAEGFEATTRKPSRQLDKLIDNLQQLLELYKDKPFPDGLHFNLRTVAMTGDPLSRDTPVTRLLRQFVELDGCHLSVGGEYDSWGGVIEQADVDALGISITHGEDIYMHGACTKLFEGVQISHDGQVRACACRDTAGELLIGDITMTPLEDILSLSNDLYRKIIEEQMRGRFSKTCRSCASFRSIYDHRATDEAADPVDMKTAMAIISTRHTPTDQSH